MEVRPNFSNSYVERKLKAAKALVRWTFEHVPVSDFGRSDHDFDTNRIPFEDETRMFTRDDHPQLWDEMDYYFENGHDEKS